MKLVTIAAMAALLTALACGGEYRDTYVDFAGPTNVATAVTQTITDVRGPVVQIHVILGTATNVDIDVTVGPAYASEDRFTLYSADDVDADKVLYPAFDRHGSDGSALTGDPPAPYVCMGDPIECVVSDWAVTGTTARLKIVWESN